jgi:hypothetical protein
MFVVEKCDIISAECSRFTVVSEFLFVFISTKYYCYLKKNNYSYSTRSDSPYNSGSGKSSGSTTLKQSMPNVAFWPDIGLGDREKEQQKFGERRDTGYDAATVV